MAGCGVHRGPNLKQDLRDQQATPTCNFDWSSRGDTVATPASSKNAAPEGGALKHCKIRCLFGCGDRI